MFLKNLPQVIFEGVPTFPDAGRMWQIVAKHKVTQLYTAPTAIRALESLGDDWVKAHDRSSLRVLGSVGEPIGPQAWHWYHGVVGEGRCPIVDTWWQTETGALFLFFFFFFFFFERERKRRGEEEEEEEKEKKKKPRGKRKLDNPPPPPKKKKKKKKNPREKKNRAPPPPPKKKKKNSNTTGAHMITPLPGATPLKPGSASLPFFGVEPALLDDRGHEIEGPGEGVLVVKKSWPSALRSLAGDPERFEATYFAPYKGYYFSGDGARRDEQGYYWLVGRVDDVINVSGHRIGTAEVEAALTEHPQCAEAAVVPVEHPIKGQGIYAFVTLMAGTSYPPPEALRKELVAQVRASIGPIATPDAIHWAPGLPKTRSGKIMRRILRKIASGEEDQLGDTSTLADPSVVQTLIDFRAQK